MDAAALPRSLVERSLDAVDPDPKRFLDALAGSVDELRAGSNPLDDGGLVALLASPEQRAVLAQVSGLMSLLEGHGDVTMDRAGAGLIPSAERFGRVLRQRRQHGQPGVPSCCSSCIGLEAKINQYEQGERFIHAVEAVGGPELLNRRSRRRRTCLISTRSATRTRGSAGSRPRQPSKV